MHSKGSVIHMIKESDIESRQHHDLYNSLSSSCHKVVLLLAKVFQLNLIASWHNSISKVSEGESQRSPRGIPRAPLGGQKNAELRYENIQGTLGVYLKHI